MSFACGASRDPTDWAHDALAGASSRPGASPATSPPTSAPCRTPRSRPSARARWSPPRPSPARTATTTPAPTRRTTRWWRDPDVDVVYVASPHAVHLEHARLAFAAGKPVLCEKPLTLNRADGEALFAAAGDLFCMEAMWMACHPLVREVRRRLLAGDFGTPRQVHADLGFVVPETASARMVERDLGAGALLDMGIYPLTFARMMLGPFARVAATADLADERVSTSTSRSRRRHEGGAVSALTASMTSEQPAHRHHRHRRGPPRPPRRLPPPAVRRVDADRRRAGADRVAEPGPRHRSGQRGRPRAGLPARRARPRARWCPAPRPSSCSTSMDEIRRQIGVRYDADDERGPHRRVKPTRPRGARVEACPRPEPADLVIVANRLPVDRITNPDGSPGWRGSPGGLVTAIEPIMRANSGIWVGWPGGTETGLEPFEYDGMTLDPISLSEDEIAGFYEGFSNATLWPLYHDLIAKPEFHREWWDSYVSVNQRFAERAASRAAEDATVWVHDYQLQLVPQLLRELRPDLRIGFYLHIPFPPAELFQQLPWRRQLLEGLLGADLVGFQLPGGAANFVRLVRQRVGHKTHRDLVYLPDDRTVRAAAFPISIDFKGFEELAKSDAVDKRADRDPQRPGQPDQGVPRNRPARLHQGHLRAAPGLLRADPRRRARRREGRLRPGRHPVARAGRGVPRPARRDRPAGRPDQRRPGPDRPPGDQLPPLVLPAGGDGRPLPRRRRHGRHALPRRDEPRRQGVRRLPLRRGRRPGALASSPGRPPSCARPGRSTPTT